MSILESRALVLIGYITNNLNTLPHIVLHRTKEMLSVIISDKLRL